MLARRVLAVLALAATISWLAGGKPDDADEAAIVEAVRNYANSAYLVKPELVEASVHPRLQKVGYVRRDDDAEYQERWMNFDQLQQLVAGWNKEGRFDPATARLEVKVLDRLDQTAVARLDAEWGIDYFHLAKLDGKWKIVNVIWQTYPQQ